MHAVAYGGDLLPVTDDAERGEAIRRRRLAQGFRSLRQFAERSGVSREAVTAAERGEARGDTYQRLEAFLDAFEHEVGEDEPVVQMLEVTVEGENVRAIVRAPAGDPAALEEAVAAIIRALKSSPNDV